MAIYCDKVSSKKVDHIQERALKVNGHIYILNHYIT